MLGCISGYYQHIGSMHCATSQKLAGLIPDGFCQVITILSDIRGLFTVCVCVCVDTTGLRLVQLPNQALDLGQILRGEMSQGI